MSSRFTRLAGIAAAVLIGTYGAIAQQSSIWLKGGISTDKAAANFEMSLKRDHTSVSGSYYYVKSGPANKLTLAGTVAGDGSFTMQEFDPAGNQTGVFQGTWHDGPDDPGVSIEGDWTKTGTTVAEAFWAEQQMVYFSGGGKFSSLEIKDAIKLKRAELSAEYPQLTGVPNAVGFNAVAKARVDKAFLDFRKMMAGFSAADVKNLPADMGNYLSIGYSIDYADDDLVSINFSTDEFTGGAHGNQGFFTLTYDLKNGREVRLAELFKPGARYLQELSNYSQKDLMARKDPDSGENMGLAQDIFADGVKPTAENFQNWAITKKGLLILFPPYQVAAYAYGPQQVIVPYSELKGIARSDGALTKVTR